MCKRKQTNNLSEEEEASGSGNILVILPPALATFTSGPCDWKLEAEEMMDQAGSGAGKARTTYTKGTGRERGAGEGG